jgi:small subunit ribosomal protein S2
LAEAKRLGVTTFGMVDTNCDPNKVDYFIPANDDATKSIAIVTQFLTAAIAEGLAERQIEKIEEETEEVNDDAAKFEVGEDGGRERGGRGGRGGRGPGGNSGGPVGGAGGPKRRVPSTQKRTSSR